MIISMCRKYHIGIWKWWESMIYFFLLVVRCYTQRLGKMSHTVTCRHAVRHQDTSGLQFTPNCTKVKFYFRLTSSVVGMSRAKLITIFAKFKISARATNVKEIIFLKQCCNPLNLIHSSFPRKTSDLLWTKWYKKFLVYRRDIESMINIGKQL